MTETAEDFDFQFVGPDPSPESMSKPVSEPDPSFAKSPKRSARAVAYQKKIDDVFRGIFKVAAERKSTVADAATIMLSGPELAEKAGNLADHDERFRKGIDWLLEGTENPYISFAVVAIPFALQIYRNHENSANPKAVVTAFRENRAAAKESGKTRRLRIPFTSRSIEFKLAFQFPSLHAVTNEPSELTAHVFSNPSVQQTLIREGINLAWESSVNGSPSPKPRKR
jgi:hypothetical protein